MRVLVLSGVGFVACIAAMVWNIHAMKPKYRDGFDPEERS